MLVSVLKTGSCLGQVVGHDEIHSLFHKFRPGVFNEAVRFHGEADNDAVSLLFSQSR